MKTTKIIRLLLIIVFFVPTVMVANEKDRCFSKACESGITDLGATNWWLDQKSKEFLKLDPAKRSISLLKAIANLDTSKKIKNYLSITSLIKRKIELNLAAVLAFKHANIITIEEFEEYILRTWSVKDNTENTTYSENDRDKNLRIRLNAPNWLEMKNEIEEELKKLMQPKTHFEDVIQFEQFEADLDRSTFDELVAFYEMWLPTNTIELTDNRDLEITRLVNFELFLAKKFKELENASEALDITIASIYQKESPIIYKGGNTHPWPLITGDTYGEIVLLLTENEDAILSTEEKLALLYNVWNEEHLSFMWYGIGMAEMNLDRYAEHYKFLRGLYLFQGASIQSVLGSRRKWHSNLKFHDIVEHTGTFTKKETAGRLCQHFFSDVSKEIIVGSPLSIQSSHNNQVDALANTLITLENQTTAFLRYNDFVFDKNSDLPEDVLFQIDTIFDEIKNELPPPLISEDCYGDKHAIYILMKLIFKDNEYLDGQKRNFIVENMRLLFRLEKILKYKQPSNYLDYTRSKRYIFPQLIYLMQKIKERIN